MQRKCIKENGRSMIEMLEKVKQPLNAVLRRQAQVFRCCQLAFAPRSNTENQVTEAPLGARQRQCAPAQLGRSMIEMLGVLAIIGVLSVGGIAGYSKAMMRVRINKTIEQISHIAAGIQTLFANQPTRYAGADNIETLVKARIISPDMLVDGVGYTQIDYDTGNGIITRDNILYEIERNQLGSSTGFFCLAQQEITPDECMSSLYTALNLFDQLTRTDIPGISNPFDGYLTITPRAKMFSLAVSEIPQQACIELVSIDWSTTSGGFMGLSVGGKSSTSAMSIDDAIVGCSQELNTIQFVFQ